MLPVQQAAGLQKLKKIEETPQARDTATASPPFEILKPDSYCHGSVICGTLITHPALGMKHMNEHTALVTWRKVIRH